MPIPVQVSAERALARGECYEGEIEGAELQRLAEYRPEQVSALLRIGRDIGRVGRIGGTVEARLTLECRVCSASFVWPARLTLDLTLARDEQEEARLLEQGEPVLIEDDALRLQQIVEDELLLALPMMPRCAACENAHPPDAEVSAAEAEEPTRRPLAALKELSLQGGRTARGK